MNTNQNQVKKLITVAYAGSNALNSNYINHTNHVNNGNINNFNNIQKYEKEPFNWVLYSSLNQQLNLNDEKTAFEHYMLKGRYDIPICRKYYSNFVDIPEEFDEWTYMKFLINKGVISEAFQTYEDLYSFYNFNCLMYPLSDEYYKFKYNIPTNWNIDSYKIKHSLLNFSNIETYKYYAKYGDNVQHQQPNIFNGIIHKIQNNLQQNGSQENGLQENGLQENGSQQNNLSNNIDLLANSNTYINSDNNYSLSSNNANLPISSPKSFELITENKQAIPYDINVDIYKKAYNLNLSHFGSEEQQLNVLYNHYHEHSHNGILNDTYYKLLYSIPDDFVPAVYKIINNLSIDENKTSQEQNIDIYKFYANNEKELDDSYYRYLYNIPVDFNSAIYKTIYKIPMPITSTPLTDIEQNKHIYKYYQKNYLTSPLNDIYYKSLYNVPDDFNVNIYCEVYKLNQLVNKNEPVFMKNISFYKHYYYNSINCPLNEKYYKKLYNIPDDFNVEFYKKYFNVNTNESDPIDKQNKMIYIHYAKNGIDKINDEYYRKYYDIPLIFNADAYKKTYNIEVDLNLTQLNQNKHLYKYFADNKATCPLNDAYNRVALNVPKYFDCKTYKNLYNVPVDLSKPVDVQFRGLYQHYNANKDKYPLNETYFKKLYNIPNDFSIDLYYQAYKQDFSNINMSNINSLSDETKQIIYEHYGSNKYKTYSEINEPYYILLYKLPNDFSYTNYLPIYKTIVPFVGEFSQPQSVYAFYGETIDLSFVYEKLKTDQNKSLDVIKFINNYEYIKDLNLSEKERRKFILLKEFAQTYYGSKNVFYKQNNKVVQINKTIKKEIKKQVPRTRKIKKQIVKDKTSDPNILAIASALENNGKQNGGNPLAGIDANSILMLKNILTQPNEIIEVDENEEYMEEVIDYVDEIVPSNETITNEIKLASFIDINTNIDINNQFAILNRVKNYDTELYNVFFNTLSINDNFIAHMKVNYPKLKQYDECKNIAIIIALDTLPHTISSLKNNIVKMGDNWAHVILCEPKNEQFFQNVITALKLPNVKLMPLIPIDIGLDQLNGFLINKQFLDNFKNKQIYIYDNISTITENGWSNKLVLKFELNM